ncbi:hypothetical protein BC833DRAFT_587100 [Globomyces pollinis-pini]|nr:hypothetical protein BC833DRAFT_587100 [Globomyces pollinis-pini]
MMLNQPCTADADKSKMDREELCKEDILDLVIVGAGPHALSLVCRLLEKSPFDVLSDADHQRLHHIGKSGGQFAPPFYPCCPTLDLNSCRKRMLVIDGAGGWMEKWNNSFHAYNIKHLRSPIYFHPDPLDPNALLAFAETQERTCELQDITSVVDGDKKAKRKKGTRNFTENDRNQFCTPSSSLFSDFCGSLVDRYFIHDLVTQGMVTEILPIKGPNGDIFKITYKVSVTKKSEDRDCCLGGHDVVEHEFKKVVYSRKVVCALGNANIPLIPEFVQKIPLDTYPQDRIVHSIELANKKKVPVPPHLIPKKLLVVGGGLTSAQLVKLGDKYGFTRIVLASRSKLKTKQFDLGLEWVGRNSNRLHCKFWQKSGSDRRKAIANAKDGGSITPEYMALLEQLKSKNVLEMRQCSTVASAEWQDHEWKVRFSNEDMESFDMIWLGTGAVMDIQKDLCFQELQKLYPAPVYGGLPELSSDLKWPGLDLFMMSGYSALSVGPSAGNLFGGRIAAQKIARSIWDSWMKDLQIPSIGVDDLELNDKPDLRTLASMSGSFVNYWDTLAEA